MGNLTVAVLGASGYAASIGKKGTSTDIILYNVKKGEDTITLIEPTRYPERLAPLFYAIALAKKAIVVVDQIDATFGETLVMLQCSDITSGYFILRNYITKEKIDPLIKGTSLEKFQIISDEPLYLRDELLKAASQQKKPKVAAGQEATGIVPIDHAFNVKGVGVVILGIVVNGIVQKHGTLKVLPGAKATQVRSIQKHDDEFDVAGEGDRVGLALKNVEVEDLDRGTVLTNDPSVKMATKLQAQATLVKYWQTPIKEGMVVHLGHWMQFLTAKVEGSSDAGDWRHPALTLTLDKPLVFRASDRAVLMFLEGTKLRVAGTIALY